MAILLRIWRVLRATGYQISEQNLGLIAAGVAFFGMLAVFPGLAAIIAIWGLAADPAVIDSQLDLMRGIVPGDVFALFDAQMTTLTSAGTQTLGWATVISILLALWSARAGVGALILGLNSAHERAHRGSLAHYGLALLLTLALVSVALVAALAVVIAPVLLALFPLGAATAQLVEWVRWSSAISVLLFGLGLVYRYGPNHDGPRVAWVTPGSVLAVVLWATGSAGLSFYLSNFGNYNEVYGSIGAAIALLVWLYLSAYLILAGAVLNAQIALGRARR